MQENASIKSLKIGKNFTGVKARALKSTMEAIVEMIQEEGSVSIAAACMLIGDY